MGLTNAKIETRNPRLPYLEPIEINAHADTGAVHLCIPTHIRIKLELEENSKKEVTLADGIRKLVTCVGPEIRCKNRGSFSGTLVMGDQPLLGNSNGGFRCSSKNASSDRKSLQPQCGVFNC